MRMCKKSPGKVSFNADIRKSNADIRRFIVGTICDHLRYICENLRSQERVFQNFHKGFTLVEILTSLGIFSIIIALSLSILVTGRSSYLIANAKTKVNTEVLKGIATISQQLRTSNLNPLEGNLRLLDAGAVVSFRLPQTDSQGNLILDANNAIIWQASGDTTWEYRFLLQTAQLILRTTDSAGNPVGVNDTVIANDITELSFSLSGTLLTINITAQKATSLGIQLANPSQLALSTTIALRN